MKPKYNTFLAALLISGANAADIDVFGTRNNPGDIGVNAPTYTATNFIKPSFASVNGGLDGGLGTNVYVVHDDANLDGDGNPKTVTWFSTNNYFVRDKIFIPKGTTLTIQPGTKIYAGTNDNTTAGKTDDAVGAITACRGGKLIADGTAAAPIVFTSVREWEVANSVDSNIDQDAVVGPAPTSANAGLWGGIILLGQAYCSFVNASGVNAGTVQIEGFAPAGSPSYDGDTGSIPDATQYGTSAGFPRKDDDNSGVVRYCSIRHGGYEFATGKEINGLTMGAVGSGTKIEFVEVYANLDDGLEFFGGRVSTNNIVVAFVQDDIFDIDEGYRGTNQFWFGIQNPGDADGGSECDGVGGTSGGYPTISSDGTLHHSKPIVYNATYIGAGANNTLSQITDRSQQVHWEKGNHVFNIEDYFNGEFYNSVFHDFAAGLVRYIDTTSIGNNLVFQNNTIGSLGGGTPGDNLTYIKGNATQPAVSPYTVFFDGFGVPINGNSDVNTNPMFTTYTRTSGDPVTTNASTNNYLISINPIPAPGSPLLTSPLSGGAPKQVSYRGAFGPEGNWAAGWTKLSQSGVLSGAAPAPAIVDTDGDGVSNTLETANAGLGFNPAVNDASTILPTLKTTAQFNANFTAGQTSVTSNPGAFNLYTVTQFNANFTAGQNSVTSNPGAFNLYTTAQYTANFAAGQTAGQNSVTSNPGAFNLYTVTQFNANFTAGQNSVTSNPNAFSLYNTADILDLRTTAGVTVQKVGNDVTLTVPVEKSTGLNTWAPAGTMTLGPFTGDPTKEFYRLEVQGAN